MCNHEQPMSPITDLSKPQRLHPGAMFFNLVQLLKEMILGLGIGLIFTLKESIFFFFIFAAAFLILLLVYSVVSWWRFTYRVEDNELRIEQGIFIRKKRYISINRIHKIDVTADVLHRLFKLVKIQIDTASSGDGAEVVLSAVKMTKAVRLRRALQTNRTEENIETTETVEVPKRKASWRSLFIAGSTSGTAGFLFVIILTVFSQIEELIPSHVYKSVYSFVFETGIFILVASILFFVFILWIVGIAGTMIKYGNFTIEKRENELFIKRGLIETKELTIPFDRIQAISINQSIIRQPINYVKVTAVVAGGSFDRHELFPVIFPLMKEKDVEAFLGEFLPAYAQVEKTFIPLAKKGLKYYLLRSSIWFLLAFVPVVYFLPSFTWLVIVLLVISLWIGYLRHRDGGYCIRGKQLTLRMRRLFEKETVTMYRRRVQAMEKKQHRLQQYDRIATVKMSLIGSDGLGTHFKLKHLEEEDVDKIGDWFSSTPLSENEE